MATYLLQGLLLGATAAAQPGAFQAFLLSLLAREGWRRTLPATLAPLISDGPILVLVLLVLTQLPPWLLSSLQVAGGLFLLYLALGTWRTFRRGAAADAGEPVAIEGDIKTNILKAALMNLLNPAPYIFWATVAGPILIDAWRINPTFGLAFLLSFYGALIGGGVLFVLVFAGAGKVEPRVNRVLGAVSTVGLFGFGLYQLFAGLSGVGAASV